MLDDIFNVFSIKTQLIELFFPNFFLNFCIFCTYTFLFSCNGVRWSFSAAAATTKYRAFCTFAAFNHSETKTHRRAPNISLDSHNDNIVVRKTFSRCCCCCCYWCIAAKSFLLPNVHLVVDTQNDTYLTCSRNEKKIYSKSLCRLAFVLKFHKYFHSML